MNGILLTNVLQGKIYCHNNNCSIFCFYFNKESYCHVQCQIPPFMSLKIF